MYQHNYHTLGLYGLGRRARSRQRREWLKLAYYSALGIIALCAVLMLHGCGQSAQSGPVNTAPSSRVLPQILIIGDYTSEQYTPILQSAMLGIATVTHAEKAGQRLEGNGSSSMELANLDGWLAAHQYAFVHVDAITDIDPCHPYQNPLKVYLDNLTRIMQKIKAAGAIPIFATATPSDNSKCHPEAALEAYNAAAVSLMQQLGVRVDDQFSVIAPYASSYIVPQTFWLTNAGYHALAVSAQNSFGYLPR